jgi:hypothetical protein
LLAELRAREPTKIVYDPVAAYGDSIYVPVNFFPRSMASCSGLPNEVAEGCRGDVPTYGSGADDARSSDRSARHLGTESARAVAGELGAIYRREDEDIAVAQRDPAEVDPALIERGLEGHKQTQNRLTDIGLQRLLRFLPPHPT